MLLDGFSTKISLGGVTFAEKEIAPPGIDGGGAIDTTTMRNTAWRTAIPKALKTLSPCTITGAYDPAQLAAILAAVNVNQEITVTFPDEDGTEWQFWGWLNSFKPNKHQEGQQPTAEIEIIPSNQNAEGAEVAPSLGA